MEQKTAKKLPGWLVLTIIALVAAILLGAVNGLTKDAIEERKVEASNAARKAVLPVADDFTMQEDSHGADGLYAGTANGEIVGYVAQVTANGYGGPIEITLGSDLEGIITGLSVGGANFAETAGLGAKAKEPKFTDQFSGLTIPVDGKGDIDVISGATITTNAVVRGVNDAGAAIAAVAGFSLGGDDVADHIKINGNTATVTKDGFAGPIDIIITVDEAGSISELSVGGDSFNETPGFGTRAQEKEYTDTFVGKTAPLVIGENIDTLSGATVTSTAVIEGANEGLEALLGAGSDVKVEGNTATATVEGFAGPVEVAVTIDDEGKILSLSVGGEGFSETPGFGARAQEKEYTDTFVGKTAPLVKGENIDIITGATVTSNAVIEGANKALSALGKGGEVAPDPTEEPDADPTDVPTPEVTTTPEDPATSAPEGAASATITKDGFAGPVEVTVTVDEEGKILSVSVGGPAFNETPGLGTRAQEKEFTDTFIGKTAPLVRGENIDIITGATVTSTAVIDAVNEGLSQLQGEANPALVMAPGPAVTENKTASATGEGFRGPIEVTVTLDENGVVVSLAITEEGFKETPGLGDKVLSDDFINRFIGKTGPFTLGEDIDGITSATVSSKAVIDAVNAAIEELRPGLNPSLVMAPGPVVTGNKTASAAGEGFRGLIEVSVTIDGSGTVISLIITEEGFKETPGLGDKVLSDDFINQFIGKTGPFTLGEDIDGITSATVSSKAVVDAVNAAIEEMGIN